MTLERAIVAYASTGAYLMHAEADRGTAERGKLTDLVVLSRNLFETAPLDIHNVQADMTVLGAKVVFTRKADRKGTL